MMAGCMGRLVQVLGAVGLAAAFATSDPALADGARTKAVPFLTTPDRQHLLSQGAALSPRKQMRGDLVVRIDPSRRFQSMIGFGAAMTDASARVLSRSLSPSDRDLVMRELFGPKGEHFSALRLTIGASDFSPAHYSLDDVATGETDVALTRFSLAPEEAEVLPLVRQARALNPDLWTMASPWSAPGWMKTSGALIRGSLAPEHYDHFASYLVAYVRGMRDAGAPIDALTVQNEPGFEPDTYPGMRATPDARAALIGKHLGPALLTAGLSTQILDHDHNWDEPQSPLTVLKDPLAAPFVQGVAWHCYKGDVAVQGAVHDARPDKDVYFTECSGGEWAPDFGASLGWFVQNLIIEAPRRWARTVLLWNLALDENHGPHLGGCSDCRGVVTINSRTGSITRNVEYYALGHASRFVRRGAVRIFSDSGEHGVDTVAFQNPDRSVVVIALNRGRRSRSVSFKLAGKFWRYRMPPGAVLSLVWS